MFHKAFATKRFGLESKGDKYMKYKVPTALVILDGFGHSDDRRHNAIAQACTPNLDKWYKRYPHALLEAAGKAVGLLDGYVSNSEVGHLTIGSGRIIEQPMSMVHNAIIDGSFFITEK